MNRVNMGVTFGDKHSYNDLGLILASKSVGYPEVKSRYIEVPGRDGDIDETEILTGRPAYGNRNIKLTFMLLNEKYRDWSAVMSKIAGLIHGKKLRVIFDDDRGYYYVGRCSVEPISANKKAGKVTISINADTYKYLISGSEEPWLWDPFDFEIGVINDTYKRIIDGTETIVFDTFDKPETLICDASSDMTLVYNGVTYPISAGRNVLYSILLTSGSHSLTFEGSGEVTIYWEGGRF